MTDKKPQNCGTGYCSCIECPYDECVQDKGQCNNGCLMNKTTKALKLAEEGGSYFIEGFKAGKNAAPQPLQEICNWHQDDDDGNWATDCGGIFVIIDGTPRDNEMKFCPYCGNRITEHLCMEEEND